MEARCSVCGGLSADIESWRWVQQLNGGSWWYRCCPTCVSRCRDTLTPQVLKWNGERVEKLVDERIAVLAEARFFTADGCRDAYANQRRRLQ